MKDNRHNTDIEEIIRASIKLTDEPSTELNNKLKATLYQQEAAMKKRPEIRTVSLYQLKRFLNSYLYLLLIYS